MRKDTITDSGGIQRELKLLLGLTARIAVVSILWMLGIVAVLTAIHFPYHADHLPAKKTLAAADPKLAAFYQKSYEPSAAAASDPNPAAEEPYVAFARQAAIRLGVPKVVNDFVSEYGLQNKRVLEVGAGSGLLQDTVRDYTALDIAESARRYFHKPFVLGSATDLPFPNDAFDAIWTIWVLEHVETPELALMEMRRVVRSGGVLLVYPAWNCTSWAAEGYQVRPFREFDWKGKIIKASVPVRSSPLFRATHTMPARLLRLASSKISPGPTRLHYNALSANFKHYWVADSDAINSIDCFEALLWFTSRGDECLNCGSAQAALRRECDPLIIRVNKNQPTTSAQGM